MNTVLFCVAGAASLALTACPQTGPETPGVDASVGTGGSATTGTGGATAGTGGASAGTGGAAAGTGGAAVGSGGSSVGTGGSSAGTGGAPTGTGGAVAGTGGATATGGRGGTTVATGGATGTGGRGGGGTTGTGGRGGTPGTGGAMGSGGAAAGGAGGIAVASIVPTLDGFLWVGTCASGGAGLDCTINNDQNQCPTPNATAFEDRGAKRVAMHTVGGTTGTRYVINFEVRGVAGGKYYTGGMLRSTAAPVEGNPGNNDGWYVGGTPTDSKWNTYEIHVTPPVPGAALSAMNDNVYYLNGFASGTMSDGRHETFAMKYKATFPVLGGGTIRMVIHDSNCLGQQNCGQTTEGQTMCSMPRTVDLTGMSPQPPAGFTQPYSQTVSGMMFTPQWLFFDVQSITQ